MRGLLACLILTTRLVVAQPSASLGGESEVFLACSLILSSEGEYDLVVMWERAAAGEETIPGYLLSAFGDLEYYFFREPDGSLRGVSADDDDYQLVITSSLTLFQYNFSNTEDDGTTSSDSIRNCRVMSDKEVDELRAAERLPPL